MFDFFRLKNKFISNKDRLVLGEIYIYEKLAVLAILTVLTYPLKWSGHPELQATH